MTTISPQQNKRLNALLTECKLMANKADLVLSYTQGRTSDSSEMYGDEALRIINHLSMEVEGKKTAEKCSNMRTKICYTARLIGWINENNETDMQRIDEYCEKYGSKKKLNDHTVEELRKLVYQFEQMKNNYLS